MNLRPFRQLATVATLVAAFLSFAWRQSVTHRAYLWTELPHTGPIYRNLHISLDDGRVYLESVVRRSPYSFPRYLVVDRRLRINSSAENTVFPGASASFERPLGGHLSIPVWYLFVAWLAVCIVLCLRIKKIQRAEGTAGQSAIPLRVGD